MVVMLGDFLAHHRASSLLLCVFDGGMAWFAITRPMPKESNFRLYDWIISIGGAFGPLLLRPVGEVNDSLPLLGAQLCGQLIYVSALFSLNKSFGVVAANRGIKTRGLYRLIRHPVYLGLILSNGAYVVQNASTANSVICVTFVALTFLRIAEEERILRKDPAYVRYTLKTRWRILPLIY